MGRTIRWVWELPERRQSVHASGNLEDLLGPWLHSRKWTQGRCTGWSPFWQVLFHLTTLSCQLMTVSSGRRPSQRIQSAAIILTGLHEINTAPGKDNCIPSIGEIWTACMPLPNAAKNAKLRQQLPAVSHNRLALTNVRMRVNYKRKAQSFTSLWNFDLL